MISRRGFFGTMLGGIAAAVAAPFLPKSKPLVGKPWIKVDRFHWPEGLSHEPTLITPQMEKALTASMKNFFKPFHDPVFRETFYTGSLGDMPGFDDDHGLIGSPKVYGPGA